MTITQENNIEEKIFANLNSEQKESVIHTGSPLLILAGAGSGKTRVLTHKIAYLTHKFCHASSVLALTFTNKAAKEMRERIVNLLGDNLINSAWIGTFHAIAARILRENIQALKILGPDESIRTWTQNFTIFDEADSLSLLKQIIKSLDLDTKIYNPKSIKYKISEAKNNKKLARDFYSQLNNFRDEKIAQIYIKYEEGMARNNALDFDDLLLYTMILLQDNLEIREYYHRRFTHVLVDEYQDTNHAQYEIIRLIVEGKAKETRDKEKKSDDLLMEEFKSCKRSLTVVGDVDQSIYSWRGADFRIIIGFQKDYPNSHLIKLEHNYRSCSNILNLANKIIENNQDRIPKNLIATKNNGDKISVFEAQDELEEAQFIAAEIQKKVSEGKSLKDFAILYRTNVQSRAIEEALLRRNIPYIIIGGFRFYDRKEIKDILSYLKVILNPSDGESLKRIVNEPRRAIGATTISKIEEFGSRYGYSLYRAMIEIDEMTELSQSAKNKIKAFVALIEDMRIAEKSLGLANLIEYILDQTAYDKMLEGLDDSKLDNIHEFIGLAFDFEMNREENGLASFLAEISLLSDTENTKNNLSHVSLMTLHSVKGLEFPIVFIAGLEEGILPHQRSLESNDKSQLEEERRLMYVGVTRAQDKLYLTHARRRRVFGQSEFCVASRFFAEAPKELLLGYYGHSKQSESKFDTGCDDTSHWAQENLSEYYDEAPKTSFKPKNFKIEFKAGDKVKHVKFGEGLILGLIGSGEKFLYQIDFAGEKKIIDPNFAKLIKISI